VMPSNSSEPAIQRARRRPRRTHARPMARRRTGVGKHSDNAGLPLWYRLTQRGGRRYYPPRCDNKTPRFFEGTAPHAY
jgi:hypothetical protein